MLGIILVMVAVRAAFRVSLQKEGEDLEKSRAAEAPPLARANLEVSNPNLDGMALEKVPSLAGSGIVVDGRSESFAQAVRLLQEHPAWARSVGEEGRRCAERVGHAGPMCRQYESLLARLYQERQPSTGVKL